MDISRHRECADPRDRIYAMLGLTSEKTDISPNYNRDYENVCQDFISHCIGHGDLSILHECVPDRDTRPRAYLPEASIHVGGSTASTQSTRSFVPDLAYDSSPHSIFAFARHGALARAGLQAKPKAKVFGGDMYVSGVSIDKITAYSKFERPFVWNPPDQASSDIEYPTSRKEMSSWQPLVEYLTGKHSWDRNILSTSSDFYWHMLGTHNPNSHAYMATALKGELRVGGAKEATHSRNPLRSFLTPKPPKPREDIAEMIEAIFDLHYVFRTEHGHIGVGPAALATGDQVVILDGARTLFVLRQEPSACTGSRQKQWRLIGDVYLLGWMDGHYLGHEIVDEVDVLPGTNVESDNEAASGRDVECGIAPQRRLVRTTVVLC